MPYTFTTFTDPSTAQGTIPSDINDDGVVVGQSVPDNSTYNTICFRRNVDGSIDDFFVASGSVESQNNATGINNSGQICGLSFQDSTQPQLGFEKDSSLSTIFTVEEASGAGGFNNVLAINASGAVCGYFDVSSGPFTGFITSDGSTYITWQVAGESTRPADINDNGDTCGAYGVTPQSFIRAADGTITTFTVGTSSIAVAINNNGDVVGQYTDSVGSGLHGYFRASDGTLSTFDISGSPNGTFPNDLNDDGVIVGYYEDSDAAQHGFVLQPDLATFETLDAPGALVGDAFSGTRCTNINSSGVVLGNYDDDVTFFQDGFIASLATAGDFALAVSNTDVRLFQESEYLDTVTVTSLSGYDANVEFTLSGSVPSDVAYAYTTNPVVGGSGFTGLYFNVGALAVTGSYPLAVVGTGTDGTSHFVDITLTIVPPPSGTTLLTFPKQSSQIAFVVDDPLSDWYVRVKKTDPYGEGDWSETLHILQADFIDSGFMRGQGSVIPSLDNLVSELFTYTSTDSSIDISWPNFTLEYADASTQFVLSGSFDGSGLRASTPYNMFPKVFSTNGSSVLFDEPNGHSAFVPNGSADLVKAANDVQADGWISLAGSALSFQVKTAAGGGSGGGGGGGSQCVVDGQKLSSSAGEINVEESYIGMAVKGADPKTGVERWAFVQAISRGSEQATEIELEDGSITQVSSSTPMAIEGGEIPAGRLRLSCKLLSLKSGSWVKVKRVTGLGLKPVVRITLSPTQWFFVGGILTHNNKVVKGGG